MNDALRNRYDELKKRNSENTKLVNLMSNTLFMECIQALNNCSMLSLTETDALFQQMVNNFDMTDYGCIDWNQVASVVMIETISDIPNTFNPEDDCYILWDQQEIPALKCNAKSVFDNLDDVLAVSFDTWLLSIDEKTVIEFNHEGKVVCGSMN